MSKKETMSPRLLLCAVLVGTIVALPLVATRADRRDQFPLVDAAATDWFGSGGDTLIQAQSADGPNGPAATITVNTTVDENNTGPNCSLREAIVAANTNAPFGGCPTGAAGLDTIEFNIGTGTPTISPSTALPTITEAVSINGNTGGATRVELNGAGAGANVDGLNITAGSSTIRALVINRFSMSGILMSGAGGNMIINCYIGTDATGTIDLGNSFSGVNIDSVKNNTIGGTTAAERNLISGNNNNGVQILEAAATGNKVTGNYIGTDISGTIDLGNGSNGVVIARAPINTIGGTTAGERNIISGNNTGGVSIDGTAAKGNKVLGNYIGTNAAGTASLSNGFRGVLIDGSSNNIVGGTTAGARNLISGNNGHGVEISNTGAAGTKVTGNYIGTNAAGTAVMGNSGDGVAIDSVPSITIGGTTAGERNLISGNISNGVRISGSASTNNKVMGNYIGTDVNGTADLGNGANGVAINSAPTNTIGGTIAGSGNLISGNNDDGVEINGSPATGNKVTGNFIGTNVNGNADLGNSSNGVAITGAPNNTIGGMTAAERNIISGNGINGVLIFGAFATGNKVSGNFIGTNAAGTADLGNDISGVRIEVSAANNTIGGTTAAERNLLSGNNTNGVVITSGATGNVVVGNYIGTDVNGTIDLGNTDNGVFIFNGATNNTIGGTTAGSGNLIFGNGASGVGIADASTTGNRVLGNAIFNNGTLGIDLANNFVTPNDAGDPDTGPNNLQNFPVLTSATSNGGTTTIAGSLNSLPNTTFRIEFFSNNACDPSGNGEGQTFLGFQNVTTNAGGNATINAALPVGVGGGQAITATATRLDGGNNPIETSEFSTCKTSIGNNPTISIDDVSQAEGNAGLTPFAFTVTLSSPSGQVVKVNYQTANGTAFATVDYVPASGTLTFNPGDTSENITVLVQGDTLDAPDETFFVNLSNPVNATIADGQGLGTILNDDATGTNEAAPPHAFAVTTANQLLSFNVAEPGIILSRTPITGLSNGEVVLGLDFRPATGQLYGYTNYNRLVNINTASGAATFVASLNAVLQGNEYGVDFNPTNDRLRIVNDTDQNASVDPTNGATTLQTPLNPGNPNVTGIAYSNNFQGAGTTTLYAIDSTTNTLYTQNPPASGTLTAVGPLGVNTGPLVGFDITGTSAIGYASLTLAGNAASLYAINLATGEAALVGAIGDTATVVRDIAISTIAAPDIIGLTSGSSLVTFNSLTPEIISPPLPITGLANGETVLAIDYRPATGQLYGFTRYNRVVTIDPVTGVATVLNSPGGFMANDYGWDFNPVVDRIRLVNDSDNNVRINPDTGALAATDPQLAYAPGDPNFGQNPNVTGAAYTNNFAGAPNTTLYDIDANLDVLVRQGSVNGTPVSPNTGQLFTVGGLGFNASVTLVGFDIAAGTGAAYASLRPQAGGTSRLFAINLLTGQATLIGKIGGVAAMRDIAVIPAGTFQFDSATAMVAENAGTVTLTITRTGDTALTYAAISFETVSGTATAPGDFTQTTGTVYFIPGETSKMIVIPITDDGTLEASETFTVRLFGATAGYFNGTPNTITVTINDND
ncbi:MAG TPA: DUF4394 domain-containing protein [Pyrinomonadaceae bacterium]|jgi:CSLREA domain-containing protein